MSIFGGNTGMTYEQLQQKRKIAEQLAMSNKYAPRNVGEGLTAIGNALAGRAIEKRAAKRESELDAEWKAQVSTMGLDPAREAIYGRLPYGSRDAALLQHMNQQDALRRAGAARGASAAKEAAQMERTQAIIAALSGGQPQGQPNAFGGASVSDALVGRQSIQMPEFSMGSAETPQMPNEPAAPAFVGGSGFMGGFTPDEVAMSQPVVNQQPPMPEPIAPMPVQQQAAPVGSNGPLSFGSAIPEPQEPAPMDARGEIESSLNRAYDLLAVTPNKGDQAAIMAIIKAQEGKLKLLPEPGYRQISEQEAAQMGLPPGQYQISAEGKVERVGGGGQTINVNNGNEKFTDDFGKGDASALNEVSAAGLAARGKLARIDRLEQTLKNAPQGMTGAIVQAAGNYGIATEGLDDVQAAEAIINSLVPEQRAPGSGPMSDADLALFKQSLARIINQPGGNQKIINTIRAITQYDIDGGNIVQRLRRGEISRVEAFEQLYSRPHPLYDLDGAAPVVGAGGGNTPDAFDPSTMSDEELQAYIERGGK